MECTIVLIKLLQLNIIQIQNALPFCRFPRCCRSINGRPSRQVTFICSCGQASQITKNIINTQNGLQIQFVVFHGAAFNYGCPGSSPGPGVIVGFPPSTKVLNSNLMFYTGLMGLFCLNIRKFCLLCIQNSVWSRELMTQLILLPTGKKLRTKIFTEAKSENENTSCIYFFSMPSLLQQPEKSE